MCIGYSKLAAPEQKRKSYTKGDWQNVGRDIISLFGTNRLKWVVVIRNDLISLYIKNNKRKV